MLQTWRTSIKVSNAFLSEWSKESDLSPDVLRHAWVQIPHHAPHPLNSVGQSATLIRWKSPVQAWQWVEDLRCLKTYQTCNCPSWSKGSDLRPDMFRHAWVQIPHHAADLKMSLNVSIPLNSVGQSATLIRWKSPVQAWQWVSDLKMSLKVLHSPIAQFG